MVAEIPQNSEKLIKLGNFRGYVTLLRKPGDFVDKIIAGSTQEPTDTEKLLAHAIINDLRYRFTVLTFLQTNKNLSPNDKLGIIYFVGLVNAADDVVDGNPELLTDTDTKKLRANILNNTSAIARLIPTPQPDIALHTLYDATISRFSDQNQGMIDTFLDDALMTELAFPNRKPGSYSLQDAQIYRKRTSTAFINTGAQLLGYKDNAAVTALEGWGDAFQMFDDLTDVAADNRDGVINPLIAMMYENREERLLQALPIHPSGGLKTLFADTRAARHMLRNAPKSREGYKNLFAKIMNDIPDSPQKKVLRAFGDFLL